MALSKGDVAHWRPLWSGSFVFESLIVPTLCLDLSTLASGFRV